MMDKITQYLLDATIITVEQAQDAAVDIRNLIADSLQQYVGDDFRIAEKVIRDGR